MATSKALAMAKAAELDLAEVAPKANPPVCKILDYGKYLYYQDKLERKQKKSQHKTEIKGLRISFRTGDHDLEVRAKQARKFLEDRDLVKLTMMFRGREIAYEHLGREKIEKFAAQLADIAEKEAPPKRQGNSLILILTPKKNETKDT